jgi:ParB family chromosome partitioning protein
VRLLGLPDDVRAWIHAGDLSVGHAKVLLGLDRAEEQSLAALRVRKENLTVRATEKLVALLRAGGRPGRARGKKSGGGGPVFADLEKRLQQHLGTRVRLVGGTKSGRIEIEYFNPQDLDRILQFLRLPAA